MIRFFIRGVHHLIFYSLPEYPQFYVEIVKFLENQDASCISLFTPLDALSMERIIGSQKTAQMLASKDRTTFMFF
jgi:U3 small nucleolar RNA-associated protein 25